VGDAGGAGDASPPRDASPPPRERAPLRPGRATARNGDPPPPAPCLRPFACGREEMGGGEGAAARAATRGPTRAGEAAKTLHSAVAPVEGCGRKRRLPRRISADLGGSRRISADLGYSRLRPRALALPVRRRLPLGLPLGSDALAATSEPRAQLVQQVGRHVRGGEVDLAQRAALGEGLDEGLLARAAPQVRVGAVDVKRAQAAARPHHEGKRAVPSWP